MTLIGREEETQRLSKALTTITDSAVVLVSGEAGVGKTAVIEDVLAGTEISVLRARASAEGNRAYGPFLTIMNDLGVAERSTAEPQAAEGFAERFRGVLDRLAARGPAVLLFEDMHHADAATAWTLDALGDWLKGRPIVVIVTCRSSDTSPGNPLRRAVHELRRRRAVDEIEIRPFSLAATTQYLAALLGSDVDPDLASRVHERSQGVPLVIGETARALRDRGRLRAGSTGLTADESSLDAVSQGLRDMFEERIAGLGEAARAFLETAALIGMDVELEIASSLAGDHSAVDRVLESGLMVEEPGGIGRFASAALRDVVRESIRWSRRKAIHVAVAEALQDRGVAPAIVASHWSAAGRKREARAALSKSARRAFDLRAYEDAFRYANEALSTWDESEQDESEEPEARLETVRLSAMSAERIGDLDAARSGWQRVVSHPATRGDAHALASATRALATVHSMQEDWDRALELRSAASAAYEEAGLIGEASVDLLVRTLILTARDRRADAKAAAKMAVDAARRGCRSDVLARGLGILGSLTADDQELERGRYLVELGLDVAVLNALPEATAAAYRSYCHAIESGADDVVRRYDAFADEAPGLLGTLAYVLLRTGDWGRASEIAGGVRRCSLKAAPSLSTALVVLSLVHAYRGEKRAAKRYSDSALEVQTKNPFVRLMSTYVSALVADDDGMVHDDYRRLLAMVADSREIHDVVPGLCAAATHFSSTGHERDGLDCAIALQRMTAETGNPEAYYGHAFARAELSFGRNQLVEAEQCFATAREGFSSLGVPLEQAVCELRLAQTQILMGRRDEAEAGLAGAYRIARNLGARPLATRISLALGRLGVGEARSDVRLTPRQREILALVAEGLTNKEVADRLYLSPRTVEMHVASALDRLDSRSRSEAVRRAIELGILAARLD